MKCVMMLFAIIQWRDYNNLNDNIRGAPFDIQMCNGFWGCGE